MRAVVYKNSYKLFSIEECINDYNDLTIATVCYGDEEGFSFEVECED